MSILNDNVLQWGHYNKVLDSSKAGGNHFNLQQEIFVLDPSFLHLGCCGLGFHFLQNYIASYIKGKFIRTLLVVAIYVFLRFKLGYCIEFF